MVESKENWQKENLRLKMEYLVARDRMSNLLMAWHKLDAGDIEEGMKMVSDVIGELQTQMIKADTELNNRKGMVYLYT